MGLVKEGCAEVVVMWNVYEVVMFDGIVVEVEGEML